MKFLGSVKKENGHMVASDAFQEVQEGKVFEAVEIEGHIFLVPAPFDKERAEKIRSLADESIRAHRKSLENLSK